MNDKSDTPRFSDLSTATSFEKAIRFLVGIQGIDSTDYYSYDDGYPKSDKIEQDAKATLEVLQQARRELAAMTAERDQIAAELAAVKREPEQAGMMVCPRSEKCGMERTGYHCFKHTKDRDCLSTHDVCPACVPYKGEAT